MKTVYVGNLPYNTSEDDIKDIFTSYGEVASVKLIIDRNTGRSKGFAFVEMQEKEALAAIQALDGHNVGGRTLRVNEARDKE